ESLLVMCSERCQQSALVLEVHGSNPIDERPAFAGELDEQPPSVAGIRHALHEPGTLEPRESMSHCTGTAHQLAVELGGGETERRAYPSQAGEHVKGLAREPELGQPGIDLGVRVRRRSSQARDHRGRSRVEIRPGDPPLRKHMVDVIGTEVGSHNRRALFKFRHNIFRFRRIAVSVSTGAGMRRDGWRKPRPNIELPRRCRPVAIALEGAGRRPDARKRTWLDSDERAAWLERAQPHVIGPMRTQSLTGLESWFTLPGRPDTPPPPPTLEPGGLGCCRLPRSRRSTMRRSTNMTVVTTLDITGLTAAEYRAVLDRMGVETRPEPGIYLHITVSTDFGYRVIEIWDKQEGFEEFA